MSRKQLSAEKQRDDANVDDDLSIAKTASDRRTISMQFHKLRQQLLCDADNDYLMRVLTDYAQMRQPERLAVALKAIIDTKEKRALVDMMCETLIPAAHKDVSRRFATLRCFCWSLREMHGHALRVKLQLGNYFFCGPLALSKVVDFCRIVTTPALAH
eukprot:m.591749 g.591749  ORF g.591749 m.591749 type:complete len:158 (-) comp22384_c0_seq5:3066-3539(-)